jgi:hypothetical protein
VQRLDKGEGQRLVKGEEKRLGERDRAMAQRGRKICAGIFKLLRSPGIESATLCSLAGRYYNPIPYSYSVPSPYRLFRNSSTGRGRVTNAEEQRIFENRGLAKEMATENASEAGRGR